MWCKRWEIRELDVREWVVWGGCWWPCHSCTHLSFVSCYFSFFQFIFILLGMYEWCRVMGMIWLGVDVAAEQGTRDKQKINSSLFNLPFWFIKGCRIMWWWRWYDEKGIAGRVKLVTPKFQFLLLLFFLHVISPFFYLWCTSYV